MYLTLHTALASLEERQLEGEYPLKMSSALRIGIRQQRTKLLLR